MFTLPPAKFGSNLRSEVSIASSALIVEGSWIPGSCCGIYNAGWCKKCVESAYIMSFGGLQKVKEGACTCRLLNVQPSYLFLRRFARHFAGCSRDIQWALPSRCPWKLGGDSFSAAWQVLWYIASLVGMQAFSLLRKSSLAKRFPAT